MFEVGDGLFDFLVIIGQAFQMLASLAACQARLAFELLAKAFDQIGLIKVLFGMFVVSFVELFGAFG